MTMKRKVLRGIALLFALLGAWLAWLAYAHRDLSTEDLLAKYGTPASQFIELDGARIHYRDEGSGPAIVLLHANFASLAMWEPWARELKQQYRVVRLDMTSHGLSGVDTTGDYSMPRTVELLRQFLDARGLESVAIVGTSIGGTIGIRFAAAYPNRVRQLVLINPGALEGKRMKPGRERIPGWASILTVYTPRAAAKYLLTNAYGDPAKVTDELVDEWWEMWRHEGNRAAILMRLGQYKATDIDEQVGRVRAPVLLVWGESDPQTPLEQADELRALLTSAARVELAVLPKVGHMAVQEAPRESLAATLTFIERESQPPLP
jgi:pimeloyl-ACP methyl ester carboxylesterase